MNYRWLSVVLGLVLLGVGCSTKKVPSGQDYYTQGEAMFGDHVYKGAIDNYQHLIDQYPFSPYAEDAELKIGLAYYQFHNFPEAINSLSDFIRMHPTSKNLATAQYYLGMAYFDQIREPDQDQSTTEEAIEQFHDIERMYPESPFAQLAHDRIEVCRESLAQNELLIGIWYQKRANFRAAESRLAELMEKYPETPEAPKALFELGKTLEQEGKKYSAAQAFEAEETHFKDTKFAAQSEAELKKLNQPVDTEEDPLQMVLAETGFGPPTPEPPLLVVHHHETDAGAVASARDEVKYGPDGLPILDRPGAPQAAVDPAAASAPVTLRNVRLAASAQPLSVIFDVSGPVKFEKQFSSGPGFSSLTVRLLNAQPDGTLDRHLVFDRSIFKDSEIQTDAQGTTVTVNTTPVARCAIIPLVDPPRLLVTFTPEATDVGDTQGS